MKLFFVLVFLSFLTISIISNAEAHSLFNSAESVIGDFRVQIATLPEVPATGEISQILIRVNDLDFNEVDSFTMGIRVSYNDEQITTFNPEFIQGAHWETDFVFERPGNHIFRVDLYDAAKDGGIITYTFNVSSQDPFGTIFIFSIAAGGIGFAIIIAYIYLPKILKNKFKP